MQPAAAFTSTYSSSIITVLKDEAAFIIAIICRRGIVKRIFFRGVEDIDDIESE
jgi:hypothetical protein